jgi:hypothetical protein
MSMATASRWPGDSSLVATRPKSRLGTPAGRRFMWSAVGAATLSTIFLLWAWRQPGGTAVWTAFDDIAEALAALIAARKTPSKAVWRAKIVLTTRDAQSWWSSTATTIYRTRTMFPGWLKRLVPVTSRWIEMVDRLVWDGIFDGRFADRDHAVAVFERHIANVEATCPPGRLLVFDVADGWEPLCSFLAVPVPNGPFPRLNDARALRRRFAAIRWGTRAVPIAAALIAALVLRRPNGAVPHR